MTPAPQSEAELLETAIQIAGLTVANVAEQCQQIVPKNLRQNKGWLGQLLEDALGATAKSKAEPDFEAIHVELKTLPLNDKHQPKESTFVCTATPPFATDWHASLVWKKLQRVLWVPVEANPIIPLAERCIGQAILWSPTTEQANILQQDWLELTEMLSLGRYADLTAKHGSYLQCRPKAAHSGITRKDIDVDGNQTHIVPRGFYLRQRFTQQLLLSPQ